MSSHHEYDLIIIGAGPAGEACAARAREIGPSRGESAASVALIEHELVGGECPYWGCMPSKALLRPAHALAETRRVEGAAQAIASPIDVAAVLARRDEIVRHLSDDNHTARIEAHGVNVIRGHARVAGARLVDVEHADGSVTQLSARRAVVLATGTRAAMPPIDGLADADAWTNREATLSTTIPPRLLVLGGGVIGVELAQAFASLGSRVTIFEGGPRLLARSEPFAVAQLRDALDAADVEVQLDARATAVHRDPSSREITVTLANGASVTGDELLVAVGRTAATHDLGLATLDITPQRGGVIEVADTMRVPGHDWLYAIGDVNGRAQFTHTAVYQGRVAAHNALGSNMRCVDDSLAAPSVMFTDPQIASVGHTLATALDADLNARAFDRDISRTAAASFHGRGAAATARLIVDLDRGLLVGATFTGPDVAEMLHAATIAIVGEVPIERLQHAVAAFPTRSGIWGALLDLIARETGTITARAADAPDAPDARDASSMSHAGTHPAT